jgi:hypothetical protein
MSDGPATVSREEQMLGELAELDLELAKHVQAKALASDDPDEINGLGRTYQRIARSCRQTLALKAKLAREREVAEAARPPTSEPKPIHKDLRPLGPRLRAHIDQALAAVGPYLERERPDYDDLDEIEACEILIGLAHDLPDFLDTPVEALVARVLEAMEPPAADFDPPAPDADEPAFADSA